MVGAICVELNLTPSLDSVLGIEKKDVPMTTVPITSLCKTSHSVAQKQMAPTSARLRLGVRSVIISGD